MSRAVFKSKRTRWLATMLLVAVAGSVMAWTVLEYRWELVYAYDALTFRIVAPAVALILGVPGIWSRTLAINFVVLVAVLGAVEAGSYVVAPPPPDKDVQILGGVYKVDDERIGPRTVPYSRVRIIERIAGEPVFDVIYETDGYGRRVVPYDEDRAQYAALFLGCSFTFGLGVAAENNAPAVFARARPEYRPYVYAVGAYGPSHALDQFRIRDIAAEVPEPIRLVVYYMIATHVQRVIGTTNVATTWCGRCSNYEGLTARDLVRVGDFNRSRPLTTIVQSVLGKSNFARAIGFLVPDPTSRKAYKRTAAVLEALRDEVAEAAPEARFVIVIHPRNLQHVRPLRRMLEERGIEVIVLPDLYDANDPRYYLAKYDRHPSAAAYELIGRAIAETLR